MNGTLNLTDSELSEIGSVDLVLSHTLPYLTKLSKEQLENLEEKELLYKGGDYYNNTLSIELLNENNYLIKLQSFVKAKQWISGHYHLTSENTIHDTKYISLDIMEFYEPYKNK